MIVDPKKRSTVKYAVTRALGFGILGFGILGYATGLYIGTLRKRDDRDFYSLNQLVMLFFFFCIKAIVYLWREADEPFKKSEKLSGWSM